MGKWKEQRRLLQTMTSTATCLKCEKSFEAGLIHTAWFGVKHGVGCSPLYSTGYSIVDISDDVKITGLLDNKGVFEIPEEEGAEIIA